MGYNPPMSDTDRQAQFQHALELFDAEEFFACHDILEEIWNETQDESREFYQGLIHAAVSLFHFTEGNLGGAKKMCLSTQKYLLPYLPAYGGLDLQQFLEQFRLCFSELLAVKEGAPSHLQVDPQLIPKIEQYLIPKPGSKTKHNRV